MRRVCATTCVCVDDECRAAPLECGGLFAVALVRLAVLLGRDVADEPAVVD